MWGFRGLVLLLGLTYSISALKYQSDYDIPDVLVNNTDDKPCILAKFNIMLGVYYKTAKGDMVTKSIFVPENATKGGKCTDDEFSITYKWFSEKIPGDPGNENNAVVIAWTKNESVIYISGIVFVISANSLSEPSNAENIIFSATSLRLLPVSYSSSLECQTGEIIFSTGGSNKNNLLTISGKYQIGELKDYKFTAGDCCPKDNLSTSKSTPGSNVGAIAGGVVAALVVLICISAFSLHFYRRSKSQSAS